MNTSDSSTQEYIKLVKMHQRSLFLYILYLLPDRAKAHDILQNTNVVLWEKRKKFTLGTNFNSWARRIAMFQVKSYLKIQKDKSVHYFDNEFIETIEDAYTSNNNFIALEEKRYNALQNCKKKLSTEDQELLAYRYDKTNSLQDISETFNRSVGALKQVFLRIRASLKHCIEHTLKQNKPI
jgi:RNA polymerase sigma-70 factor (ECF subfamily)